MKHFIAMDDLTPCIFFGISNCSFFHQFKQRYSFFYPNSPQVFNIQVGDIINKVDADIVGKDTKK